MKNAIKSYFRELKIEYYGVLSYDSCIEIAPRLAARGGFTPKSVIVYLLPYYAGETENISRYAASRDYHEIIGRVGEGLTDLIQSHYPDARATSFGDHSPIDERHAAASLGLGVLGENKLLINERYGSYVFIGDVITDLSPDLLGASEPVLPGKCCGCGACLRACPTGILRSECPDCLSAITQRKGDLLPREIEIMRKVNTGWGCDVCQEVCPHNASPVETPIDFFREDRIVRLDSELLSRMTDDEVRMRAFGWRGRAVPERNAAILEEVK